MRAVGSHGISFDAAGGAAPDAGQHADRPARAARGPAWSWSSERIEEAVPPEYAELLGITTLVCTPLSAGGPRVRRDLRRPRRRRFELSDGERHLLWTLGKTAALVATARNATRQQERTRRLGERLDLAREIHERVMQRLFGVSLALGAAAAADPAERERCRVEMQEALADLRRALERPLAPLPPETGTTLAAELERLAQPPGRAGARSTGAATSSVPADLEPLAQSVLAEALRNVAKHAEPTRVDVAVARDERHVHARGAQRRRSDRRAATPGWACGWPRSRRSSRAACVEFGPTDGDAGLAGAAGRCRSSRRPRDRAMPPRLEASGCACSSSTTTTSCTGASACCSASSRGSSAASRRAPATEALALTRTLQARTSRSSTCSWPASRAPTCARRSARRRRRRACC